ncbi:hypothetical protein BO86DRAFT_412427 [Aspergillus japonicus CBS 114.51]|uniref:CST complex subunit Stn1 N-terminal domain-containing protein n=1 Tax=Aspergillus japonicus CBS 114.51 TaxID=1448312 RepID=A0A8T8WRA9_ASPJA|nr:hypothetical protein BO86DRAFT_412427 [Aspergillus japonicus CBS 114.51]RAH78321.1 hypothetical protein BO86DRAFT_412427 [Aspergillus japonicus CBS 114.51]
MAPPEPVAPEFYPAYCFKASPTHFTWVKMAVADVLQLTRRAEYPEGIFFHQNHPIHFIAVAGLITARTEYPRVTVLTLDDSSGAVLDVVVQKADAAAVGPAPAPAPAPAAPIAPATAPAEASGPASTAPDPTTASAPHHIAPTTALPLDIHPLVPGALAHLKGTLSIYRHTRIQLQLERCALLRGGGGGVNAEMRFLEQRDRFRVEVLDAPWVLAAEEVARLRREADAEEERGEAEVARWRRRARRRVEREERDGRKIWERWEVEEGRREKEAAVVREAGVELMRLLGRRGVKRGVEFHNGDGAGDGSRNRQGG